MTIYTTKKSLQQEYWFTRYRFEYLFRLWVIVKVFNQHEKKVWYLLFKI